jgi:hypothetical protein
MPGSSRARVSIQTDPAKVFPDPRPPSSSQVQAIIRGSNLVLRHQSSGGRCRLSSRPFSCDLAFSLRIRSSRSQSSDQFASQSLVVFGVVGSSTHPVLFAVASTRGRIASTSLGRPRDHPDRRASFSATAAS